MARPTESKYVYVGFDEETIVYTIPANQAVRIFRPNGSELSRWDAQTEEWVLTYRGPLAPGQYEIRFTPHF